MHGENSGVFVDILQKLSMSYEKRSMFEKGILLLTTKTL